MTTRKMGPFWRWASTKNGPQEEDDNDGTSQKARQAVSSEDGPSQEANNKDEPSLATKQEMDGEDMTAQEADIEEGPFLEVAKMSPVRWLGRTPTGHQELPPIREDRGDES